MFLLLIKYLPVEGSTRIWQGQSGVGECSRALGSILQPTKQMKNDLTRHRSVTKTPEPFQFIVMSEKINEYEHYITLFFLCTLPI